MRFDRPAARGALLALLAAAVLTSGGAGCAKKQRPTAPALSRTYAMGFTWFPPRPELALATQVADLTPQHADRALVLISVPWDSLLDGAPADRLVRANPLGLASYYRAKGLGVVVSIDPTNGYDRAQEDPALVARHLSLADAPVQAHYRRFVVAMDTLLRPERLGIASETNLVRKLAPALYAGLVQAAAGAATDVHAVDPAAKLFVTIQVETAWGGAAGPYAGIATDRTDFPFAEALGLSSFPYLAGFGDPDSLPHDYFARLVRDAPIPVFALEGGWPSDSSAGIPSTPDAQRRYVRRQSALLDEARAVGWFQINFTDLERSRWPAGAALFSRIGLVDTLLRAKPALADWDAVFARRGP